MIWSHCTAWRPESHTIDVLGTVILTYTLESSTVCECTYNVSKEKYVCKIFAVLISLYVNSRLNGFHKLMVFTIIVSIADLTLGTCFHGNCFCIFTQVPTFYWLFRKIWPRWIRNKSYFKKKLFFGEVMTERKNWILRIQYMATWCDGTFDVNMTSSEVVHTRHHIRGFLRISLVLKIKTEHKPYARHHRQ